MTRLSLADIRRDGGTQPRAAIDLGIVEEYAEALAAGATFPPVVVFYDGTDHWLADGFHRWHAWEAADLEDIECDVRQGTQRDAILFSCSANAAHGMRRTNADKRRAVLRLLDDPEWAAWSDREIARRCGVGADMVGKLRPAPASVGNRQINEPARPRLVERGGTVYQQNTARIGTAPRPAHVEPAWTPADVAPVPRVQTEREQQIARDNENGFISSALWEIERQMAVLPPALECIERFPTHHHHTLSAAQLRIWSEWFATAAEAWERLVEGSSHVAAE